MKPEKLPSGHYRVRVYNKYTGKKASFTAPTAKSAKALADEYMRSLDSSVTREYTVKEAIESYITNRLAVLSPSTIRGYRRMQKNNYDEINHFSVDKIASVDIQRFVNDLSKKYAPKSVRAIYGLLISSIKDVRPNKAISVSLPQKKPVERHIPTDNDIKAMMEMAKGNLRKGIILASVGTLRAGEVCAIKYEDIKGNTIHIHADLVQDENNKWVYKDVPKNSTSDRYIEFSDKIIEELGKGNGFVVSINPNTLTKEFIKLRNKLGLKCRFHDLRHYAASLMHYLGVPDEYIMERGGWKSDAVLKDIYRNALSDKSKEFSDRMNNYMNDFL